MATHTEETTAAQHPGRSRLTLDIDRALHTRIRLAAFREGISMREYIERILEAQVPEPTTDEEDELRPMAPDALERLRATREAISQGRVFSDSTQIVRQMRKEQSRHLGQL